jgi:adenine-specific DNA-methyltransferase
MQISDENIHHVREIADEIFGANNFCSQITFSKNSGQTSSLMSGNADYILWYAKDISRVKYRQLYLQKTLGSEFAERYDQVELVDGSIRSITVEEAEGYAPLPTGARVFALQPAISAGYRAGTTVNYTLNGKTYHHGSSFPAWTPSWLRKNDLLQALRR